MYSSKPPCFPPLARLFCLEHEYVWRKIMSYSGWWEAKCAPRSLEVFLPFQFLLRFFLSLSLFISGWPDWKGKSVVRHLRWVLCLSCHSYDGETLCRQCWRQQVRDLKSTSHCRLQDKGNDCNLPSRCMYLYTQGQSCRHQGSLCPLGFSLHTAAWSEL